MTGRHCCLPSQRHADRRLHRQVGQNRIRCKVSARSHPAQTITPHVDADVPGLTCGARDHRDDAERTFWDKVVILHGLRRWPTFAGCSWQRPAHRGTITIFRMLQSDSGKAATKDAALGADCVAHARMFFQSTRFRSGISTATHICRARMGDGGRPEKTIAP